MVDEQTPQQRIAKLLLDRYNIRIEPEMSEYLLSRLNDRAAAGSIAIMGGNARTGVAIRQLVAANEIASGIEPKSA